MEYRIKHYHGKGWIAEYKKKGFFRDKWIHVTHYAGLYDNPFYYRHPEDALQGALEEIEKTIRYNFHFKLKTLYRK